MATVRISSEKTGEKSRESSAEPPANTKPHLTSPRCPVSRKLSSPPAPDIMFLRGSASPEEGEVPRPLSTLTTSESVDAELSKSVTPQHRKLLANMATGSPKPDRPRVSWRVRGSRGWGGRREGYGVGEVVGGGGYGVGEVVGGEGYGVGES